MIGVSLRKIYMSGSPENICDIHKFSVAQPVRIFMKGDHSITSIEIG